MKKKIYILLTIDTEGHRGNTPVAEWIYGKYKGKEYGINKIMDICDALNIGASFFLDIAEAWTWGDKVIRQIGTTILNRNHDLQMHLHPDHFTKSNRLFLHNYNYEEQRQILQTCLDKFIQLFEYKPIAFRAGKYGANYDTLNILSGLGIKQDFSMFYNQKWCDLNNPPFTINNLKKYKNLIEVPVTVFKSFDIFGIRRFEAISIDSISPAEFKKFFKKIIEKNKPRIIVLMLHSFSFIKMDKKGDIKRIDKSAIKRTKKILKILSQKNNISFITTSELWQKIKENNLLNDKVDFIPEIKNKFLQYLFTFRRAWGIFGQNKKATLFILLNFALLILVLFLLLLIIKIF